MSPRLQISSGGRRGIRIRWVAWLGHEPIPVPPAVNDRRRVSLVFF